MASTVRPETIRTFVAFGLPQWITDAIQEIQKDLKTRKLKIRWVPAKNLHMTLKFLGPTGKDQLEAVGQALTQALAGFSSLRLRARGLGVFPGIRRPRIVWIGIDGDIEALRQMQQSIEDHLAQVGFAPEKRSFKAHLTIGRVKGTLNANDLLKAIQAHQEFQSAAFQVRQIELIKSDLKPQGPQYSRLLGVALQ